MSKIQNRQYDDQMMQNLQKLASVSKYLFIAGFLIVVLIGLIILSQGVMEIDYSIQVTIIILTLIGFLIFGIALLISKKTKKAKNEVAGIYAKALLANIMDQLDSYDRSAYIARYYINQDLGFPGFNHHGFAGDYVRGVLHGVPLEFSEFELQTRYETRDNDGEKEVNYKTEFYGVMIVCRHELSLSDGITISQYKIYEDAYKTDDEDFNKDFSIKCSNEQDAKLALSSYYIEALKELSIKKGKRFAIRFLQDGTLLLVIRDMNLFEMGDTKNTAELVAKLESEINDFVEMVDVLTIPAQRYPTY